MSTALRIVRPLPAADQHTRALVVGSVVFGNAERGTRNAEPRKLPPAIVQLNRRVVELSLERAGIESALAGVRRRIARLQADADALQSQLAGITLGDAACFAPDQRAVVDRVLLVVAKELAVPIAALLGRRGVESVCWARFIALTLAHERSIANQSELARYLNMDHGTVHHARKQSSVLREACPAFRAQWERCVTKLEEKP